MKPVCVSCRLEMVISEIGMKVEEMQTSTKPYRLWYVDKFKCPKCLIEVITRFAAEPAAHHFEENYAEAAQSAKIRYWSRLMDLPGKTSGTITQIPAV